jgi:vitamin B12 transporter
LQEWLPSLSLWVQKKAMRPWLKYGIVICFSLAAVSCRSQGLKDTVVAIKDIPVQAAKLNGQQMVSTSDMELDRQYETGKRLSDVLGENTSVFIKNYGVGQLSSISVNGSSAAQTAILWNGIKINNPNTGQTDLALFDMGTIDNISLVNTASNQSVGGMLALNNNHTFSTDTLLSNNVIRYGSFNTLNLTSNNSYTIGRFYGSTKINYISSDNDFPFVNTTQIGNPVQIEKNAATSLLSFLQQLEVKLNRQYHLGAMFWVTDADRQLPPVMTDPSGFEHEWDKSYRSMAYFTGKKNAFSFSLKSSYLYDWLRYTDPVGAIDSRSSAQAIRNIFNASYDLRGRWLLDGTINYDHEQANSSGYNVTQARNVSGLSIAATYRYLGFSKIGLSMKQDLLEGRPLPFCPAAFISAGKAIHKHTINVTLNGARAYRLPALNDLYWTEGGNPNLQPEHAWNSSLNADYSFSNFIRVNANGFYDYVTNWILWTPSYNAIWTAENVKRVVSRGVNLSIRAQNKASLADKGFVIAFYAGYSYTNTISLDAATANDNSKDKQLIYVPLHNLSASLQLQYRRFYIRTIHSYTGIRYTATDDSQSLPGYYLTHVEVGKDFYFHHRQIGLAFRVNNIANAQYQVIAVRPMPGRNYEMTVRINLAK